MKHCSKCNKDYYSYFTECPTCHNKFQEKKYHPQTKEELKILCDDESIYLGDIDTSKITDMSKLFYELKRVDFSGIETWNVSNVKNMSCMFYGVKSFNQPIGNWDVSKVENMGAMFCGAISFNQDIGKWNISSVKTMQSMFTGAESFNQDISEWNVVNVTNMQAMFNYAKSFNQPIGNWDVSNVQNMSCMFLIAKVFNQNIGNWNVSKVEDMSFMFDDAKSFNQDISKWNVSNVKNMSYMFYNAESFNQPICNWDISNVKNMSNMFDNAESFKQLLPEKWAKKAGYENPKIDEKFVGVIYILINPAFLNLVKIGYSNDIERRIKELSSNTAVPDVFHCYAIYKVKKKLADKDIHELIDSLNPSLRYSKNREFYEMDVKKAYSILLAIAKINNEEEQLVINPFNDDYFNNG